MHIHDIFLPYVFHPNVLNEPFDWQETTLVAALLINNLRLKVLVAESALAHGRAGDLQEMLPDYKPLPMRSGLRTGLDAEGHFPASLWLQTC